MTAERRERAVRQVMALRSQLEHLAPTSPSAMMAGLELNTALFDALVEILAEAGFDRVKIESRICEQLERRARTLQARGRALLHDGLGST